VLNPVSRDELGGARLEFVDRALGRLASEWRALGFESLALPRIAAGLGGLPWDSVRDVLERHLAAEEVDVEIYS